MEIMTRIVHGLVKIGSALLPIVQVVQMAVLLPVAAIVLVLRFLGIVQVKPR